MGIPLAHPAHMTNFALELRASLFLSFDKRQCRLARAAGLRVTP